MAVVSLVADVIGTEPADVPPLYESVDPDAMSDLFVGDSSCGDGRGRIVFPVADRWVVVRDDDEVIVLAREDAEQLSPRTAARDAVYRTRHEWTDDRSLSTSLLLAVDAATCRDVLNQVEPLAETVDPDALDRLFRPIDDASRRDSGWVRFSFGGLTVVVDAAGEITLTDE